jgi:cytochrome oxidase assembly protein ShyY1
MAEQQTTVPETGPRRFRPGWQMGLFVALLLPVTTALGFWQLARAAEKERLDAAYVDSQASFPASLAALDLDRPFQRVEFDGEYEPNHFLIDNQIHAGQVGYRVVTPLRVADGRRFLIDRGWIPAPSLRSALPTVDTPPGPVRVVGSLWRDMGMTPLWGEDVWNAGWPKRIQRLDVERAAGLLPGTVPVEVRIEAGSPGALVPTSSAPVITAAIHYGYAVQWFGLAVALLVLFVVFGIRQGRR